MEETMKDLQRQQAISEKEPRFWKSVSGGMHRDAAYIHRVQDIKSARSYDLIDRNGRFQYVRMGDLSQADDRNLMHNVIQDRDSGIVLMKFYEKKSSWDCDGKLRPQDYVHRVGPAQYFYPDGRLAALEMYDEKFDISHRKGCIMDPFLYGEDGNRLDHFSLVAPDGRPRDIGQTLTDAHGNVVNVEDYDRFTSLYFDKEGNSISRSDFDVIYMKELDSMGLFASRHKEHFEYAPRIGDYNDLVNDLHVEMTVGGDRFDAQDIRELHLADKSDDYLKMLSDDIMKLHHSLPFHEVVADDGFMLKMIDRYVYGLCPNMEGAVEDMIARFKEENLVDDIQIVGDMNESFRHGAPGSLVHVVMEDEHGVRHAEGFKRVVEAGEGTSYLVNDGPYAEYYPDGSVASFTSYEFDLDMHLYEAFPETRMNFDDKGRLTTFEICESCRRDRWKEYEQEKAYASLEVKVPGEDRSVEKQEKSLSKSQQMYLKFCESEKMGVRKERKR